MIKYSFDIFIIFLKQIMNNILIQVGNKLIFIYKYKFELNKKM